MKQDPSDRRTFLKSAVAGTAVAAIASQATAYSYLNLEEQAFK